MDDREDSVDDVFAGWNPGGSSRTGREGSSSVLDLEKPRSTFERKTDLPWKSPKAPGSFDLSNWSPVAGLDPDADVEEPRRPRPRRSTGSEASNAAKRDTQPNMPAVGSTIHGFRILSELGRGAFARVYLAEQEDLANRLVAIKISQPQGEEPWALARLQHTHIVPIHSVHIDPATGLRVLCMPYFGGANLAELLETAGARLPERFSGRSLIDALDRVGGKTRILARRSQTSALASARSEGGSRAANSAGMRRAPSLKRPGNPGGRSIWRWVSLSGPWSAFLSSGQDEEGRTDDPQNDERAQPFRRFLREASFERAAIWIAARLAEGLEHAHSRGLLHRDLKPSNVLVSEDGTPMLLDFNLAVGQTAGDDSRGAKALVGGTLPYMAPEHIDAFNPKGETRADLVDERSDIYSLGLILFEMLAGRHPFVEPPETLPMPDLLRLMTQERRSGAPSLRRFNSKASWSLDSIARKCLDPEPARRYARARDLAEDLDRQLDDRPLRFAPEPSLRERAGKWARRNPWACSWSSVAIFAVALITIGFGAIRALSINLAKASARIERSGFINRFNRCQLLLNTQGPTEHLDEGIALARQALGRYRAGSDPRWIESPLVRRLPPGEQAALREDVGELVILQTRAEVFQSRRESESDRRRTLVRAVAALDAVERFLPRRSPALYDDRSRYLAALGEGARAAADRSIAESLPASTSRDFYLEGASLLIRRRNAQAERALLRAVELEPKRFWSWFLLGICRLDQGRFLEASGDFAVCTALEPGFDWPYLNRGIALARAGRLGDAKTSYTHALRINNKFATAYINRGFVELDLGDAIAAERDLERGLELAGGEPAVVGDPTIRIALGKAFAEQGRLDDAERLLTDLIARSRGGTAALVSRGFVRLLDPKRLSAAKDDFSAALKLDANDARAWLGLAHVDRGADLERALASVSKALEIKPDWGDALEQRAIILARLGRLESVEDIDKLAANPTPKGLYNAACAAAVLAKSARLARMRHRAIDLLARAFDLGYPAEFARSDPDLAELRGLSEFDRLIKARAQASDASR